MRAAPLPLRQARPRSLLLVFGVLIAILLLRLGQLQLLEHQQWLREARRARSSTRRLAFRRGRILDREGRVLAQDRRAYDLHFQYREFRRGHPAGQLFEAASLLQIAPGGLPRCWERGETLGARLLAVSPPRLRALPSRDREDLLFYLARLGGLRGMDRWQRLVAWAEEGTAPLSAAFPEALPGFQRRMAQARRSWKRLQEQFPDQDLMLRLEDFRRRLEARVRQLALRAAAARVLGLPERGLVPAMGEARQRQERLRALGRRWALDRDPALLEALERLLFRPLPAAAEEFPSTFKALGVVLRRIEEAHPEDLEGLRRPLLHEVHESRTALLRRDIDYALVDLVAQNPDAYPGFEVEEAPLRDDPGSVAPRVVGILRQPTPAELQDYYQMVDEARVLSRILDPSPAERARLRELRRRLARSVLRPDDLVGATGVESLCRDTLRGERGFLSLLRRDAGEVQETFFEPPRDGADVRIAIDAEWTAAAEEAFQEGYERARELLRASGERAKLAGLKTIRGGLALMDLRDGSVPVLASLPRYTVRELRRDYEALVDDPDRPLRNRAIGGGAVGPQLLYPGSTFKLVTAVEALSQDPAWATRELRCDHLYRPSFAPGVVLRCTGNHGDIDLHEAIQHSCNIYFYQLADRIGYAAIWRRARELGFGRPSGLDLTCEADGAGGFRLVRGDQNRGLEFGAYHLDPIPPGPEDSPRARLWAMRLSIGQSHVQSSPLQLARFYGWLACGKLWRPRVVLARGDRLTAPHWTEPPLDPRVRDYLDRALRDVTARGTAYDSHFGKYQLSRFDVAGKTGTAQIGRRPDGGEIPTHAWFAGYFPADRPRYAVAVLCENTDIHGGQIATYVLEAFLERCYASLMR